MPCIRPCSCFSRLTFAVLSGIGKSDGEGGLGRPRTPGHPIPTGETIISSSSSNTSSYFGGKIKGRSAKVLVFQKQGDALQRPEGRILERQVRSDLRVRRIKWVRQKSTGKGISRFDRRKIPFTSEVYLRLENGFQGAFDGLEVVDVNREHGRRVDELLGVGMLRSEVARSGLAFEKVGVAASARRRELGVEENGAGGDGLQGGGAFVRETQAHEEFGSSEQSLELRPVEQAVIDDEVGQRRRGIRGVVAHENRAVNLETSFVNHLRSR